MGDEGRETPIGRALWDAVQVLHKEFDSALARVGGSRPVWFILLALCSGPVGSQRELAERVGIQDATLTHHLTAMEGAGLIRRFRSPENRRVHKIEITKQGEALFATLRDAAKEFDGRIRRGVPEADIATVRATLERFVANAGQPAYDPV